MQASDQTLLTLLIRREKTTYFISSSPYESIDSLKRKILIFHKGLEVGDVRLYHLNKLLDDKSNLHDQGILNNSLIYYKLRKNTGEWQQIAEICL